MIKLLGKDSVRLTQGEQKELDDKASANDMPTTKVTDENTLIEANISALSDEALKWLGDRLKIRAVK